MGQREDVRRAMPALRRRHTATGRDATALQRTESAYVGMITPTFSNQNERIQT
jgi:hypothetical protein